MPWILILVFIIQFALIFSVTELADESYYRFWSQNLSLYYVDHPPLIAFLYRIGGRWLNLLLMPFFCYLLGRVLMDVKQKSQMADFDPSKISNSPWLFYILLAASPLGLSSLVIFTPDTPMIWAWCLGVYAWYGQRPYLMVVALLIGIYGKLLFLLTLFAFLRGWSKKNLMDIIVFTSIGLLPLLWGQIQFSMMSDHLSFQWHHRLSSMHQDIFRGGLFVVEWLLFQLFLISPFVIKGLWHFGHLGWRIADHQNKDFLKFLLRLFVPNFLFCFLFAMILRVEGNWSALFALSIQAVFVLFFDEFKVLFDRKWQGLQGLLIFMTLIAPWVLKVLPLHIGPPRDPVALSACIDRLLERASLQDQGLMLLSSRYQEMSLLIADQHRLKYLRFDGQRMSQFLLHPELMIQLDQRSQHYLLLSKSALLRQYQGLCPQAQLLGKCTIDLYFCRGDQQIK